MCILDNEEASLIIANGAQQETVETVLVDRVDYNMECIRYQAKEVITGGTNHWRWGWDLDTFNTLFEKDVTVASYAKS